MLWGLESLDDTWMRSVEHNIFQLAGKDLRCHLVFTKIRQIESKRELGVQTFSNPTDGLKSLGSIAVV